MEIDIRRSCRSCLSESNSLYPICKSAKNYENFGSVDEDSYMWSMSIAEVIMAFTIVNVNSNNIKSFYIQL